VGVNGGLIEADVGEDELDVGGAVVGVDLGLVAYARGQNKDEKLCKNILTNRRIFVKY